MRGRLVIRDRSGLMAFTCGRQAGLSSASDTVDQLTEQIIAYRRELQEARTEHAKKIADLKAHFDAEAVRMRREFEAALAELRMLDAFSRGSGELLN